MFFSNLESIKARMEPYTPDLTPSTYESSRSEINMALNDEEKAQLRTRIKIKGTIDKTVFEEFKRICELEIANAEVEDKVQPTVSHVLELLLRKGIRAYKPQKTT